jgi:hypothetical protein
VTALLAEYTSADALLEGARAVVELVPPSAVEAYTPHPVEELEDVLALRRSPLPRVAFAGGLAAFVLAWFGQRWITAGHPEIVGGRPFDPIPAYVPVAFELTVLGVVLASFLGWCWVCGLPRLWTPLSEVEGFEHASLDAWFLRVAGGDADEIERALRATGAVTVRPC